MGKYEEALERARAGKPIDEVFPELKESEDERIRKGLIRFILYKAGNLLDEETEHKFIAYLESQKKQKPMNSTREKIISRATFEKQVVLISESSGKAEIGWDTRSLEDAKKLLEYGLAFINKNGINPAEKQDYTGLNDLERAIHRGFLSAGVENVPVTIIKETAQECLSQMKPAEWSEDVVKVVSIVYKFIRKVLDGFGVYSEEEELIDSREAFLCCFSQDCAEEIIKSLRPSWKPSEQQMEVFKQSIEWSDDFADKYDKTLQSLYNDLQKLM